MLILYLIDYLAVLIEYMHLPISLKLPTKWNINNTDTIFVQNIHKFTFTYNCELRFELTGKTNVC